MHYVIGLITAIAGLLWALNSIQRSGFNLSSLNPFAAYRRWQWSQKNAVKPLYRLNDPVEVAAVLLLGVAKCRGELSRDQKSYLLGVFREELSLSAAEADDLLVASSFLLRDEVYIIDKLERILAPSKAALTPAQRASILKLMQHVAEVEGVSNDEQRRLIERTDQLLTATR